MNMLKQHLGRRSTSTNVPTFRWPRPRHRAPFSSRLAVSLRRARRKSCESFEKSENSAKIHLKVVSAPECCSGPLFLTFSAQMARRPQAGREILAKMINIFPTFRCTSSNSQHQHLGSAFSTKFHFLRRSCTQATHIGAATN